jgi:hypothetical protein
MSVTPQPPTTGTARVMLRLRDAQGRPLAARAVELEATMSHPGMRPSFATARPERPDRWVAEVELTMGGDWVVLVEATLEDGGTIRRTLPLPGVVSR